MFVCVDSPFVSHSQWMSFTIFMLWVSGGGFGRAFVCNFLGLIPPFQLFALIAIDFDFLCVMHRQVLIMSCVCVSKLNKTLTETRKMHFHVHFSHPQRINFRFFSVRLTFILKSFFILVIFVPMVFPICFFCVFFFSNVCDDCDPLKTFHLRNK